MFQSKMISGSGRHDYSIQILPLFFFSLSLHTHTHATFIYFVSAHLSFLTEHKQHVVYAQHAHANFGFL